MPNRILREGILTSERVNQLSTAAELFYRRLMSVVDDYGRFSANTTLLRTACYPLLVDKVREGEITKHLAEAQAAGLILIYEVASRQWLQMLHFRQRIRVESKCPAPPPSCLTSDGQMTDTGPPDDGHLHALVGGVVEVEGEGESARARRSAEIPTVEEVIAAGISAGVPEDYCRNYWEKKDIQGTWTNKFGRLIKWQSELVRFWNADRDQWGKKKRNGSHLPHWEIDKKIRQLKDDFHYAETDEQRSQIRAKINELQRQAAPQ